MGGGPYWRLRRDGATQLLYYCDARITCVTASTLPSKHDIDALAALCDLDAVLHMACDVVTRKNQ